MLRKVGLLDAEPLLDGSRGDFAVPQRLHDRGAGGMRERLKDARLIFPQHVLHNIRIFAFSNIRNSRSRSIKFRVAASWRSRTFEIFPRFFSINYRRCPRIPEIPPLSSRRDTRGAPS